MSAHLHPVIVHFPIAFLALAAVVDAFERLRPAPGLRPFADTLYVLGGLGALAGAVTGQASLDYYELPGALAGVARRHEVLGSLTAWIASAAMLARLGERWMSSRAENALSRRPGPLADAGRRGLREAGPGAARGPQRVAAPPLAALRIGGAIALFLGLMAASVAVVAGLHGGRMVHEHGVTRATIPERARPANSPPFDMAPAQDLPH